jgi:hypothetical protein
MMKAIAYPVMMIAGIGLVACFCLYIGSLAAPGLVPRLAPVAATVLFPGIFVVWLPTVLLMNRFTRDFKQRDLWKAALRGCPASMRTGLWVVIGFVIFAAFVVPLLRGQNPGPGSFLIFPASFYSVSFCVMYSILHVDKLDAERRCLNGHRISPVAKFCEECGAPAAPEGIQQPSLGG